MLAKSSNSRVPRLFAATFFTAIALAGCTSDKIVYRERGPFNPPPDQVSGFLGYYDSTAKQTTCGNCHADFQRTWVLTRHANAVTDLKASGHATAVCFSCHTITGNGNSLVGKKVGHDALDVGVYNDVQCESCHGPGLKHVEGISQGTLVKPLARVGMTGSGNCGDCHTGVHNPFVEEWSQSGHAAIASTTQATNPTCIGCHEGRGVLAKWGVTSNFVEKDGTASVRITCAVCHNPHGSPNDRQLRYPITSADPDRNLCMQCHMRRSQPDFSASSPHAPQGAVLIGTAGWRPPGFAYDTARIFGSHATDKNPRLCAGCHVTRFTVTDKATGTFTFQATGHLMRPIPCLDATGKPTADKTCAYAVAARSWQSCTASGCHFSADVAATAFTAVRGRMKFYADQLWLNLNNDGTLQATPTDGGLLATLKKTRPGEWSNTDNMITPAEGAEFNARLCGEYNQSNSDNSKGVHNPFLCEALLTATIDYVRTFYGLPAASVGVQSRMTGPIGGEFNRSMHVSYTRF